MSITLIFVLFPFIRNACSKFPQCKKCSTDETKCTQCDNMYTYHYIDEDKESITYGQCILCPVNCKSCGPDGCNSCIDYYGLNENKECVRCTDPKCTKCPYNYSICTECRFVPSFDGKCGNCSDPNCVNCKQSASTCVVCYTGYQLENNKCILIEPCQTENCKECSEDKKDCEKCNDSYYLDKNKECQACPNNCRECNESHCIACETRFGFNDKGECVPCEEPLCAYCYKDYKKCTTCSNPLLFKVSANNDCEHHCTDKNCKIRQCSYDNASICSDCIEGFYLSKYGECIPCDVENCKTCRDDKAKCTSCKEGYSLYSNQCIKIDIPYCTYRNYGICEKCITGYVLSNGECKKCIDDNCARCTNDTLTCLECKIGSNYLLEKGSKNHSKCVPCKDKNCYSCSIRYDDCGSCKHGFISYEDHCITKKQYLRMQGLIPPGDDDDDDDNPDDGNNNDNNNNPGNDEKESGGKSKLSKGAIIGIAVGCGAAVVIIVTIIIYFAACKKPKVSNASSD